MLEYNVDVETAGGHTKAARLTLDRLAVGQLVERSVPALVVPRGQMKTNLLGMSFLDRLESWEVRADRLMLHGYPDVTGSDQRLKPPSARPRRSSTSAIASRSTSTPAPGLTPFSARWRRNARAPGTP